MNTEIKVSRICSKPKCDITIPKGRSLYCSKKCCVVVNDLRYYYNHRKFRLEYQKNYYNKTKDRDKEKRSTYYKAWYQKNRDKHREYMRNYHKKNESKQQTNIPKI